MYGLSLCLSILLVFGFLPSALPHAVRNVHGGGNLNNVLQEANQLSSIVRGLNLTSTRILENLSLYEESNSTCADGIIETLFGIFERKIWALQMLDSSSAIQSGLLAGNLWDLGSYDECLGVTVDEGSAPFTGQHCLIYLNLAMLNSTSSSGTLAALGGSITYKFSLCFPSVCSPSTLSLSLSRLSHELNVLLSSHNYSVTLSLDDSNCHTAQSPPLTVAEICGILIPALFIAVALLCTIVDVAVITPRNGSTSRGDSPMIQYCLAFSYCRNGARLFDTRVSDDAAIQVLHGIKFICMAWVVIGHRFMLSVQGPLINTLTLADFIKKWTSMLLLNAPLSVDVFFVISGILNTYSYLNTSSRASKSVTGHVMGYVHRYVRLTPAYAMVMLVEATWLYRLGDGPYWSVLIGKARYGCTHYWWSGLLYVNNYVNPNHNCLLQSWYLAADMQMFWLSPLVLYSLWRWPRLGLFKVGVLLVVSLAVPFCVAYIDQIKAPIPISLSTEVVNTQMAEMYMPTHTKTISYVLGILGGYVLHRVKKDQIQIRIHRAVNVSIWVLAAVSMGYGLFGGYEVFQLDSPYNRVGSSLYIAVYRLFWSVGIVWIIVACTTGHGGLINTFLSLKGWMPLGRLTYSVYLTHAAVILYSVGSLRVPQYFSYYTMILGFLGELVVATLLAVVLSLTIESPTMAVEKLLRGGSRAVKRPSEKSLVEESSDPINFGLIN